MEMAFIATSDPDGRMRLQLPRRSARLHQDHRRAHHRLPGTARQRRDGEPRQHAAEPAHRDLHGRLHPGISSGCTSTATPASCRPAHMLEFNIEIDESENAGRKPVQWVLIHVTEAYIHCSKHIPLLVPAVQGPALGHGQPTAQGRRLLRRQGDQNRAQPPARAPQLRQTAPHSSHAPHSPSPRSTPRPRSSPRARP